MQVKYKLLQDVKKKKKFGFTWFQIIFCNLLFDLDEIIDVPKNRRFWELEGDDLRFVWHGYLWYDKAKVNVDFKTHFIRYANMEQT